MELVPPAKRRKLSPPGDELPTRAKKASSNGRHDSAFLRNAEKWDLENTYESKARKNKKKEKTSRLPIKTFEGNVEHIKATEDTIEDDVFSSSSVNSGESEHKEEAVVGPEEPKISDRQQIIDSKEELARLAGLISEAPEENVGRLRRLAEVGQTNNTTVQRLALATQLTVYKDIIPGYRIRPWTDADTGGRLTKEVKALRNFEQGLVSSYQAYVKDLSKHAMAGRGNASESKTSLATTAITCASSLLLSVPHFNFRGDLLKILVDKLSTRQWDDNFAKCVQTIESLFSDDEDGQPSLDGVLMLTRMIKGRDFRVHEAVLNTFLRLRLLSEFSLKASQTTVDKEGVQDGKVSKKKRVFRTKKERKAAKEIKVVQKEMSEADAIVSKEERDRLQAEMLKLVFKTYFQILKARSASLMGAVLEGLAKYAHLINQDFFGDILEVLRELCGQAADTKDDDEDEEEEDSVDKDEAQAEKKIRWSDPQRAVLLCTTTAFELLSGQDASKAASSLHLDLSYFTTTLYRVLPSLSLQPDIELSSKSLHLPDPCTITGERAKVNARATATLLIRALTSALMPRPTPQMRVAAFSHRLGSSALQTPERTSTALLGVMNQITKVHGKKIAALWDTEERRGDGTFNTWGNELDTSNPFAGTMWSGELLRLHYAPSVRDGVVNLERAISGFQGKR